ncbi:MAG: DUF5103 domain-containing protein [Candidatus Symbiothrix sp.]|nr:DUF5103 domain-containing protein [Candidatus Symbiothrix sp.]
METTNKIQTIAFMRKSLALMLCLFFVTAQVSISARKSVTEIFSDRVKTLRVSLVDAPLAAPVINLEGDQWVEVSFDVMGGAHESYTYTLTHCNADWTPSQLIQSEYMSGFQHNYIDDYAVSFNTTMDYVNYRMTFPNENLTMKVSGNYLVKVFPQNENKPILAAAFSVVEPGADITMQVTSQTDKGMNKSYQQVNFAITYGNEVKTPMQDLKVYVQQNNRSDNEAALIKPLVVQNRRLVYEHNPALIFDGGNEYHSFEMTTHRYNGLNIEAMEFHSPYYHAILRPDRIRNDRSYLYTEDINGRFFIRSLDAIDYDNEADYYIVHFYLPCEEPFAENVYILGELFNNVPDERSRMEYSQANNGYVKSVLLKEGYYNYLYVTRKDNISPASTTSIEGNFFQTENEYRVWVYFRPMGSRYDKLIGYQTVQYK